MECKYFFSFSYNSIFGNAIILGDREILNDSDIVYYESKIAKLNNLGIVPVKIVNFKLLRKISIGFQDSNNDNFCVKFKGR